MLTTHPELLDANGSITGEDLLVVHFPGQDRPEASITD
ncbi:putative conserved membrane protein [Synechococcus sp. ROS8604]|nr:putative conserved membrane protein [Synechococcus sp. ROS8604]